MEKFAAWQHLAEIARQVPLSAPDDNNPEMMAEIAAKRAHHLVRKRSGRAVCQGQPADAAMAGAGTHWACLRADIERLAAKAAA